MQGMTRCGLENEGTYRPSEKDSSVLSQREVEILAHVVAGFKDQEIAEKLGISPHKVNSHLNNVYEKINIPNRLQAIFWAIQNL